MGMVLLLRGVYQLLKRQYTEAGFVGGIGISLLAFLVALNPPKRAEWLGSIALWIALAGIAMALGVTVLT